MENNLSYAISRYGILLVVGVAVFVQNEILFLLPFVFAGPCGCDADAGGPGGDNCGSDDDGDGGDGGDGGDTDTGPGCGFCDGGDTGGGGSTSTPYLYIKNKSGKYVMQNDVMIGSPSTYVMTEEEGRVRYEAGMLGTDVYSVKLDNVDIAKGLRLQIREIEPEESFIYDLRYHLYSAPRNTILVQDWTHAKLYAFAEKRVRQIEGHVVHNQTQDVSGILRDVAAATHDEAKKQAVRLETDDTLSFTITRRGNTNSSVHLIISSFWRNWVPGQNADDIHRLHETGAQKRRTPLYTFVWQAQRLASRSISLLTILGGLFFGGSLGNHAVINDNQGNSSGDLLAFIKKASAVRYARADTPHTLGGDKSLKVSYRHPTLGLLVHIATVQPRVYLPTDISVPLPTEAFGDNGETNIVIEATKAHYVKNISVFEGDDAKIAPVAVKHFSAARLGDSNVVDMLKNPDNNEPVHMAAGDTLALETDPGVGQYTHMALEIKGFYMPLRAGVKQSLGDWETRLLPRERALLASMYS